MMDCALARRNDFDIWPRCRISANSSPSRTATLVIDLCRVISGGASTLTQAWSSRRNERKQEASINVRVNQLRPPPVIRHVIGRITVTAP